MEIGVVSMRYARALLLYATEKKTEDQVYKEMKVLAHSFVEVPDLRYALENPVISMKRRQELIELAAGGKVCEESKKFIAMVLKENREKFLMYMATSYLTLYRKQNNITEGKLITAAPASAKIIERMKDVVTARTKGTVLFDTSVDPSIEGGFVLEYDTYRLDASVAAQLKSVLKQFKQLNSKLTVN